MKEIIVVAHNIRSTHNVGSIFRTADGFGVKEIIISGYTPFPKVDNDPRLPHIREKITKDIHKTALGAERVVPFLVSELPPITDLKKAGFLIVGLEQTTDSISLYDFSAPEKLALIIGEEVAGISEELLVMCDSIVEIPMVGMKESFNVSVATGIALYQCVKPS